MKSIKALAVTFLAAALSFGAFSSAQASGSTQISTQDGQAEFQPARFLKGTWVGKAAGYNGGRYQSSNEAKFVITETKGFAAKGTQQWRAKGAKSWSPAEPVYFTLLFEDGAGLWQVYGAEGDATYQGSTTQDGGLFLIYLEAGRGVDDAAMRITLKKRR